MIVADVKRVMQRWHRATVSQVAAELGQPVERVAMALRVHAERGRVVREESGGTAQCATVGCTHCPLADACLPHVEHMKPVEVFVWNGRSDATVPDAVPET